MKRDRLRLAVVGSRRGLTHMHTTGLLGDLVELTAVCDINASLLTEWEGSSVTCYTEYEALLGDREVDAICIASPLPLHASQAIAALEAGKHVLCEVTAAWTLEEGRALAEAVERTGLTYMMAENCCFFRENMMIQRMVELGLFGELIMAEGSYLHDCSHLFFHDGGLAWRGEMRHTTSCNWYATHSLGPVAQWLGINRSDHFASMTTWGSSAPSVAAYSRRNFGKDSPYAATDFWAMPDSTTTLIKTAQGRLIEHRLDNSSPRPRPQNRYALQGTDASFVLNPDFDEGARIWLRDRSPTTADGRAQEWEPLAKYADQWEHPLWKEFGEVALASGHGGADYFVLREFACAIRERRAPVIDIYDALAWSAVTPLSARSLAEGGAPVEFPRFVPGAK